MDSAADDNSRKAPSSPFTRAPVGKELGSPKSSKRSIPHLDKITPIFNYDPCTDGILLASSFGSSLCIICDREDWSERLLKLPCSHEAHPNCFPHVIEKQGCCPECGEPICYKICGHRVWYKLLTSIQPSTREFDGICTPCGGTSEARRQWNIVDREQPDHQVQAAVTSYADYIEPDDYRLFDGILIENSSSGKSLQSPVRSPSPLPWLDPSGLPVDEKAPRIPERRAARFRYMVWEAIGRKYEWQAPKEILKMRIQDVMIKYRKKAITPQELDIDTLLQKCRGIAERAQGVTDKAREVANATKEPMSNAKAKYNVLCREWCRLEELWLQLKLVESQSHGVDTLALPNVSEGDTRHLWVKQLQKTTDAAMQFCSLPEIKAVERVLAA